MSISAAFYPIVGHRAQHNPLPVPQKVVQAVVPVDLCLSCVGAFMHPLLDSNHRVSRINALSFM